MSMTQPARYNLDLPHIDDEMEMATSPYRQADDIDIDLDPEHEPVNKSLTGESTLAVDEPDPMQADTEITYQDDDMIDDEEFDDQKYDSINQDLSMEAYHEDDAEDHDEDIIFDETEVTTVHYEPNEYHDSSNNAMPLDQDQYQDQEQEPINPTDTTKELNIEQEHDDHQHQTTLNSQTSDERKDPEEEPTTHFENLSAEQPLNEHQGNSEAGDVSETYIHSTEIKKKSGDTNQDDAVRHQENTSNIDTTDEPEYPVQQEAQERQQSPLGHTQKESNTDDSNTQQVIESEEPDNSIIRDSQPIDNEGPTDEISPDLHPVVVTYLGQEMSFFPPSFGDVNATFFLADPTLAYDPFEKLLVACRSLLGESLEHDDELVLDIPTLGLHICEDSKYASELGLAQVLDIYLSLSRNERIDTPEPLYCHLSSRVCLSSQYSYLANSVREGKCYSEIAADYAESPEEEVEIYEEESEHQRDADEDRNIAEEVGQPEQEDINNVVANTDVQEESVAIEPDDAPLQEEAAIAAEVQSSLVDNSAAGADDNENTKPVDPEIFPLGSSESTSDNAEQIETISSKEQKPQSVFEEHEDFDDDDEEPEKGLSAAQDDVDELPEEVQTPSSHTVEADYVASQQDFGEDQVSPDQTRVSGDDGLVPEANDEYAEDTIDYSDEEFLNEDTVEAAADALDKQADNEIDEDLFAPQSHGQSVEDDTTNTSEVTNGDETNSTLIDKPDQVTSIVKPSHGPEVKDDDFLDFPDGIESVPVTPSKPTGNKRKVLDEDDELRFLDLDTPEPKRRRPS